MKFCHLRNFELKNRNWFLNLKSNNPALVISKCLILLELFEFLDILQRCFKMEERFKVLSLCVLSQVKQQFNHQICFAFIDLKFNSYFQALVVTLISQATQNTFYLQTKVSLLENFKDLSFAQSQPLEFICLHLSFKL